METKKSSWLDSAELVEDTNQAPSWLDNAEVIGDAEQASPSLLDKTLSLISKGVKKVDETYSNIPNLLNKIGADKTKLGMLISKASSKEGQEISKSLVDKLINTPLQQASNIAATPSKVITSATTGKGNINLLDIINPNISSSEVASKNLGRELGLTEKIGYGLSDIVSGIGAGATIAKLPSVASNTKLDALNDFMFGGGKATQSDIDKIATINKTMSNIEKDIAKNRLERQKTYQNVLRENITNKIDVTSPSRMESFFTNVPAPKSVLENLELKTGLPVRELLDEITRRETPRDIEFATLNKNLSGYMDRLKNNLKIDNEQLTDVLRVGNEEDLNNMLTSFNIPKGSIKYNQAIKDLSGFRTKMDELYMNSAKATLDDVTNTITERLSKINTEELTPEQLQVLSNSKEDVANIISKVYSNDESLKEFLANPEILSEAVSNKLFRTTADEDTLNKITGIVRGSLAGVEKAPYIKDYLPMRYSKDYWNTVSSLSKDVDKGRTKDVLSGLLDRIEGRPDFLKTREDKIDISDAEKDAYKLVQNYLKSYSDYKYYKTLVPTIKEIRDKISTVKVLNEKDFETFTDKFQPIVEKLLANPELKDSNFRTNFVQAANDVAFTPQERALVDKIGMGNNSVSNAIISASGKGKEGLHEALNKFMDIEEKAQGLKAIRGSGNEGATLNKKDLSILNRMSKSIEVLSRIQSKLAKDIRATVGEGKELIKGDVELPISKAQTIAERIKEVSNARKALLQNRVLSPDAAKEISNIQKEMTDAYTELAKATGDNSYLDTLNKILSKLDELKTDTSIPVKQKLDLITKIASSEVSNLNRAYRKDLTRVDKLISLKEGGVKDLLYKMYESDNPTFNVDTKEGKVFTNWLMDSFYLNTKDGKYAPSPLFAKFKNAFDYGIKKATGGKLGLNEAFEGKDLADLGRNIQYTSLLSSVSSAMRNAITPLIVLPSQLGSATIKTYGAYIPKAYAKLFSPEAINEYREAAVRMSNRISDYGGDKLALFDPKTSLGRKANKAIDLEQKGLMFLQNNAEALNNFMSYHVGKMAALDALDNPTKLKKLLDDAYISEGTANRLARIYREQGREEFAKEFGAITANNVNFVFKASHRAGMLRNPLIKNFLIFSKPFSEFASNVARNKVIRYITNNKEFKRNMENVSGEDVKQFLEYLVGTSIVTGVASRALGADLNSLAPLANVTPMPLGIDPKVELAVEVGKGQSNIGDVAETFLNLIFPYKTLSKNFEVLGGYITGQPAKYRNITGLQEYKLRPTERDEKYMQYSTSLQYPVRKIIDKVY